MLKNIFFDFDGVILDSVQSKTNAFFKLYEPYGAEVANRVVNYHLKYGGLSRFEKLRYFEEIILERKTNQKQIDELAKKFRELCFNEVINSSYVEGVINFLDKCQKLEKRMWVISGTPQEELREIVRYKKLDHYFLGVFGTPGKKTDWVNQLTKEHDLDRKESLFIGDALTDYEASRNCELLFLLRETNDNLNYFKDIDCFRMNNFKEIPGNLEKNL
tara:strand:- start:877 stop:1527 length:651 start_codon:yes stop_codon:yes gene_type:complete